MGHSDQYDTEIGKKPSFFKRFFAVLLITIALLAGTGYAAMDILIHGPSAHAGSIAVHAIARQPVVNKLLALYLTPEEIAALEQPEAISDGSTEDGGTEKLFSVYPELG